MSKTKRGNYNFLRPSAPIQQPNQAKISGLNERPGDRKAIDPAIIAEENDNTDASHFLYNPYLFAYATLIDATTMQEVRFLADGSTRSLTGSIVSSIHQLKDPEKNDAFGAFFVFPDISIRIEDDDNLASKTDVAPSLPLPTSILSTSFAEQGLKLRLRKRLKSDNNKTDADDSNISEADGQDTEPARSKVSDPPTMSNVGSCGEAASDIRLDRECKISKTDSCIALPYTPPKYHSVSSPTYQHSYYTPHFHKFNLSPPSSKGSTPPAVNGSQIPRGKESSFNRYLPPPYATVYQPTSVRTTTPYSHSTIDGPHYHSNAPSFVYTRKHREYIEKHYLLASKSEHSTVIQSETSTESKFGAESRTTWEKMGSLEGSSKRTKYSDETRVSIFTQNVEENQRTISGEYNHLSRLHNSMDSKNDYGFKQDNESQSQSTDPIRIHLPKIDYQDDCRDSYSSNPYKEDIQQNSKTADSSFAAAPSPNANYPPSIIQGEKYPTDYSPHQYRPYPQEDCELNSPSSHGTLHHHAPPYYHPGRHISAYYPHPRQYYPNRLLPFGSLQTIYHSPQKLNRLRNSSSNDSSTEKTNTDGESRLNDSSTECRDRDR